MLSTKVIKEKIKDPYYHISFLAFLTALGVILNLTELFIPRPLPWIKFGFANIISLFLIIVAEIKDVFCVLFLRIILSSIFAGKLFGPGFILSISGGTLSTFVMIIVYKSLNKIFSLIGISILGAITHNLGQLLAAYFLFLKEKNIFYILPLLLIPAFITGFINGLILQKIIK